jgi:hypothetical protein
MTRADIIKEMGPALVSVTDTGHVVDVILRERRFQASKRRFKQSERYDGILKRIRKHQQYAELR